MQRPLSFFSESKGYRWYVLGTVLIGAFMSALDASIVNIALPTMNVHYHTRLEIVEWVSLAYLLTLTLLLPVMGKLADMLGRGPLYNAGFIVFGIGSYLCGAASGIFALILWRVVQALGASMLQANSLALITQVFPERERGRAIGIQGAIQAAAMSFGPFLGGLLVEKFSTQSIFYINVPIALAGTVVGWLILPKPAANRPKFSFDYLGAFAFSAGLLALMLGLTQVTNHNWFSAHEHVLFLTALFCLGAFLAMEIVVPKPFIKLGLFLERNFTIGNISGMLSYMALFSPMFLLPFYLERVLKLGPSHAGTVLTVVPLTLSAVAVLAGYLSDKFGVRPFTVGGMVVMAVGLFAMATLHSNSSAFDVAWRLVILGLGMGIFTPPNNRSVMSAAPEADLSVAGGLLNMMRSLGMMGGVAFAQLIYAHELRLITAKLAVEGLTPAKMERAHRHAMMVGYDKVYIVMIAVALAAAFLSLVKEREERAGRIAMHISLGE